MSNTVNVCKLKHYFFIINVICTFIQLTSIKIMNRIFISSEEILSRRTKMFLVNVACLKIHFGRFQILLQVLKFRLYRLVCVPRNILDKLASKNFKKAEMFSCRKCKFHNFRVPEYLVSKKTRKISV